MEQGSHLLSSWHTSKPLSLCTLSSSLISLKRVEMLAFKSLFNSPVGRDIDDSPRRAVLAVLTFSNSTSEVIEYSGIPVSVALFGAATPAYSIQRIEISQVNQCFVCVKTCTEYVRKHTKYRIKVTCYNLFLDLGVNNLPQVHLTLYPALYTFPHFLLGSPLPSRLGEFT
mmetsp:Transcript_33410/g.53717  ORF Transcript_33410/g.53717 Transcript_33410/m.53717 type:complete len:170 (+) Transcript_33410:819-1328(+)